MIFRESRHQGYSSTRSPNHPRLSASVQIVRLRDRVETSKASAGSGPRRRKTIICTIVIIIIIIIIISH